MRRFVRSFWIMSVLGGVIMIFSASSFSPSLSQNKERLHTLLSDMEGFVPQLINKKNSPNNTKNQDLTPRYHHEGKDYVYIDGKFYEYNERHVYTVNGTPTYYFTGEKDRYTEEQVVGGNKQEATGKKQSGEDRSLLEAYSPGAGIEMINTIQQAKENMNERQMILDEVMNEGKRHQ